MERDFVSVVSEGQTVIINLQQITVVVKHGTGCEVVFASNYKINLDPSETEKLVKRLPGAVPTQVRTV